VIRGINLGNIDKKIISNTEKGMPNVEGHAAERDDEAAVFQNSISKQAEQRLFPPSIS